MRFLILFILLNNAYALVVKEHLSAMVLKSYKDNVVALSRGFEDGVKFQDHIKIMNGKTFFARAVCIKVLSKISFWKVYRTTKGAIQSQNQYELISIPLSEIKPALLREIAGLNLDFLQNESQETILKSN